MTKVKCRGCGKMRKSLNEALRCDQRHKRQDREKRDKTFERVAEQVAKEEGDKE